MSHRDGRQGLVVPPPIDTSNSVLRPKERGGATADVKCILLLLVAFVGISVVVFHNQTINVTSENAILTPISMPCEDILHSSTCMSLFKKDSDFCATPAVVECRKTCGCSTVPGFPPSSPSKHPREDVEDSGGDKSSMVETPSAIVAVVKKEEGEGKVAAGHDATEDRDPRAVLTFTKANCKGRVVAPTCSFLNRCGKAGASGVTGLSTRPSSQWSSIFVPSGKTKTKTLSAIAVCEEKDAVDGGDLCNGFDRPCHDKSLHA
jgi:hypothetical protein